ncbi:SDR family NAD(P)-dependent oxidoreductase [Thermogemmatispora sp.]|uniref:SDR family NAD(P)-dependent oxidoreductase n=1 Tax=Thermogemmatispora sp. TaxID=1968838 RepID=UPI0035E40C2F
MLLAGQIAIVTGAGRGIGRAIALAYAREGASLVIAEKDREPAQEVAEKIRGLGGQALVIETDVAQESSVNAMVERVLRELGTIDILVTNAGIQRRYFVHQLPTAEFQAMLDVNLLGTFYCCRAVLPTLYARRTGTILMIASDSGRRGYAYNAAYCASKFAVIGFMEALADEARAYAVRVNALCPAGVKTRMSESVTWGDGRPLRLEHFMEPEEVADVALFLVGPGARAIHGQAIPVYGGVTYRLE